AATAVPSCVENGTLTASELGLGMVTVNAMTDAAPSGAVASAIERTGAGSLSWMVTVVVIGDPRNPPGGGATTLESVTLKVSSPSKMRSLMMGTWSRAAGWPAAKVTVPVVDW